MVKIYDENMKEVRLPKDGRLHYGSYPLDLSISSFEYETRGRKQVVTGRQAAMRGFIVSSDDIDMDMKIDRVQAFLRQLGEFYVAKGNTPFKLLKVQADQSYTISPGNGVLTEYEIPLTVLKPYFKQSLLTSMTIDADGMMFNDKWAYGMGTWFAMNYWQYSFTNQDPTFYNSGDEEVKLIKQKDSIIRLVIKTPPPNGLIDIDDGTTTFKLWRDFRAGDVLIINGDEVRLNGVNVLGDTNFNFLTVKKGWNYWDIRGVTDFDFSIDFRYLYD